jgi:hypothetical protein
MKGGSGITYANPDIVGEDAFNSFISNSTIIGRPIFGTEGILLRYKSNDILYKSIDVTTYDNPVDTILVKFIPIEGEKDNEKFNSEVFIQNDIYDTTKDGLEPLCPAVLFSKIYDKNDLFIKNSLKFEYNEFTSFSFTSFPFIGIIAMEFVDYQEMVVLLERYPGFSIAAFIAAAFLLIELAYKTSYTQGDFHFRNIFFKVLPENPKYPFFLINSDSIILSHEMRPLRLIERLKPLIIDFGKAKKIKPVTEMYNEYKFREILGSICAEGCFGKYNNILSYPDKYGWASGSNKPIYSGNVKEYEEYEEKVKNFPNELVFFKNAPGVKRYFDLNLNDEIIENLNQNLDGENGFMNLLITARNKSRDKIDRFKLEYGNDSEISPTEISSAEISTPRSFFSRAMRFFTRSSAGGNKHSCKFTKYGKSRIKSRIKRKRTRKNKSRN